MGRHLRVAAVDLGLVEAGADHPGLEVVRHDQRRHGAESGEGAVVRADPVGRCLGLGGLGLRIMFEAPITAMKISAGCAVPVVGSITDIRVPE